MLAVRTIYEDTYGATPEYDDVLICDKCDGEVESEEPYIENWSGKIMCGECISRLADEGKFEEILEFVGQDSIFDLLNKIGELQYR